MTFDPLYVSNVLSENFKDAQTLFVRPLLSIHHAHLVMLADCGIVAAADAARLRDVLGSISPSDVQRTPFDANCEDLFFHIERLVTAGVGEDIAGRLHTARSRNDIDMTMYRIRQREFVAELIDASLILRSSLLNLADEHKATIFPAVTHTQPAQPTTIAHYLMAIIEALERDATRLRAAYASTNRCPLGACAITGTGFPIDRQQTSDLLGFDRPTGNTYGSIATVDYLIESMSAVSVMLVGLGRVLQDLLVWCTPEFGYLRLADGFVQCSSIMPQKRNPVALEHARAITSKALGQAHAVSIAVHNTPFGDIVDTEDDLQPLVAAVFADAIRVVRLLPGALRGAQFDVDRLAQNTLRTGTTLTELADQLVRDHGLPFKTAHAIGTRLVPALINGETEHLASRLAEASQEVLGYPLLYTDEQVLEILSPEHFISIRATLGGPAPSEIARAINVSRTELAVDASWVEDVRNRWARAELRLRERSASL